MKKKYKIEVDCANCANKMEAAAKKTEGVKEGQTTASEASMGQDLRGKV